MVKWNNALRSGKIVSLSSLKMMTEPGTLADGSSTQYGFGWLITKFHGHPVIWHNGGTLGFGAVNAFFPDRQITIIGWMNSIEVQPEAIAFATYDALFPGEAVSATSQRYARKHVAMPEAMPQLAEK